MIPHLARLLPLLLSAALILPLKADSQPNILFIMVDDLGYGDLSSFGAPDLQSPHIDGLMEQGMRFDQFYANCPVCSPTRAALMSGLYPDNAGVPGVIRTPLPDKAPNWGKLRSDITLLPQILKDAGYHTGMVGKWHLGMEKPDRPNDRGFDHWHGFLGDMMDDYYDHLRHGNNYMRLGDNVIDPEGHATDLFSDWAIDYVKDRESRDTEQPWFLYLAYNAPHTPIQPPEDWLMKVTEREEGITDKRAKLVALIEHMDAGIGKVLGALKDLGVEKETLVVFTSDNGGQVNVGGRNVPLHGGKQDMWEGGIRVSTCVVWPEKIAAGERSDYPGLTMDFYPTLGDIAGAEYDEKALDGRSFAPLLLGEEFEADPERYMFWVRLEGNARYGGIPYHAARKGDWKILRNTPWEPYQLFNLAEDPAEERPVPREKAPQKYNELFNALLMHINGAGQYRWQRDGEPIVTGE